MGCTDDALNVRWAISVSPPTMRVPTCSLTDESRPLVFHGLLILAILGLWVACIVRGSGFDLKVTILSLAVVVPSLLAMSVYFFLRRIVVQASYERRHRVAQHVTSFFGNDDTPTVPERVALRRDRALARIRHATQMPLQSHFLVAASLALAALSIVRLYTAPSSDPATLDFGPAWGRPDRVWDEPDAVLDSTRGIVNLVLGFLASFFLFPIVQQTAQCPGRLVTCPWNMLVSCIAMAGHTLVIYLAVRHAMDYRNVWAVSSFWLQVCEWTWGYLVGLALGDLVSALVLFKRARAARSIDTVPAVQGYDQSVVDDSETQESGWFTWPWTTESSKHGRNTSNTVDIYDTDNMDDIDYIPEITCFSLILEHSVTAFFVASLFVAAVFTVRSWDHCWENINCDYDENNVLANNKVRWTVWLGIPLLLLLATRLVQQY